MNLRAMRLRILVPLLVLGVGLMVAMLIVIAELRQTSERAVATAIRQVAVLSGIMVEDIERGLRRGDRSGVQSSLRPIRASRTTAGAVILDDADRVIHATERRTDGFPLSRTRFASEAAVVDSVRRSGRPQHRLTGGGSRLLWAHPFSMPPREGELLPSTTGVLLVQYGLDIPWNEAMRDAVSRTATALLTIALLCVLVSWGFHRYFTPRLDTLVHSTERIAAGDYRAAPHLRGHDELAQIGRAIAEMAAQLERKHTQLEKSEAELRRLNAELEGRVQERTAESAAYARDMEAFAYTISHDLRTPLRSIAGFAQVLAQDHLATLGQEGVENLGRVLLNAKRMSRLIDDILAFSRHRNLQPNTITVNMTALARSVGTELLSQQKDKSRINLRIDEVPTAVADDSLIRQVLQNLLANAIKYSGTREKAEIHFGYESDPRGPVYFVSDNGVGFSMKFADRLFTPFQRLHAPGEYEGTGVGLAIVKRILNRHGGSAWVFSEPGKGTTFYFAFFDAEEARALTATGTGRVLRAV